jgi:diguanylate cyclase (GGDEF)-like protein/PAS domain S-box-containing protein
MTEPLDIATSAPAPEIEAPSWEKPNPLVLKLILATLVTYNLLFVYQLGMHYFFPHLKVSHYDLITNLYLCIIVNIAACIILSRYHRMATQVEQELAGRLRSEQALQQAKDDLEQRVAERIAELEEVNRGFVLEILQRELVEDNLKKAHEYLEKIFESSADGIGIVDQRGQVTKWNKAAEEIYGYNSEEILGQPVFNLYADRNELMQMLTQLRQEGFVRNYEIHMKKKDGGVISCSLSIRLLRGDDRKIIGSVTMARDLTEIKQSIEQLKLANEQLQGLIAETDHRNRQMTMIQEMGEILHVCQTHEEIYDAIAHFTAKFFPGFSGAFYRINDSQNLFERVATWGESPPQELLFSHDDCWALRRSRINIVNNHGSLLRCRHVSAAPFGYLCQPLMAQGAALGILHLQQNAPGPADRLAAASQLAFTVAEGMALALANVRLQEALRSQAIRDPLTGLFNRRYMIETFERELARVQRQGVPLGVIMTDLDNFKQFNDTFGHDLGDKILMAFGEFIRTVIRKEDLACRWGGEEFCLILPGASLPATLEKAEEIRSGVRHLQVPHAQPHRPVTLSVGVAVYPEHGSTRDELFIAADKAMYQAKHAGRDRVITANGFRVTPEIIPTQSLQGKRSQTSA